MHEAVENSHKEVVEFLLLKGANVKGNVKKRTPLHLAVIKGDVEMVRCIIENDKNISTSIDIVDTLGCTPLYWAAAKNNVSILKILLANSADVNLEDILLGRTPLQIAVANGNLEAVKLLLKHNKAKLDNLKRLKAVLLRDSPDKNLEAVKVLLKHNKGYVNTRDRWGWTAFDYAVTNKDKDMKIIKVLINYGANIDTKDPLKILLATSRCNTFPVYLSLKQLGIYDDVVKLTQAHDLRRAAKRGDIQKVSYLLESGVDVNAISDSGLAALHYAADNGHEKVAEILISHKAAVDLQDNLGIIPLGYAIYGKYLKIIKTLTPYTDLLLQDNCGETVKDLDERKGASNFSDKAEKRVLALRERVTLLVNNIANSDNNIANMQLESSTEAGSGPSTNLANDFANMQLKPSTEACPAEMDGGVKEQRAHSPHRWKYCKRKLSTEMDSDSSTETDKCNYRRSYGRSSKAIAVQKRSSFSRY